MTRALALLIVLFVIPREAAVQPLGVLRIRVALADADGTIVPIPRVVLLVSDNPATTEPKRIRTGPDGTVEVNLRPGNYTVESDQPIAFRGRAYQWTQILDVAAGRSTLELTSANAEVGAITTDTATPGAEAKPVEADSAALLTKWQDSVVEIWTSTAHGSGVLIDARGLVATNQRIVGNAATAEVQISRRVKVAASVLAADPARDVAILWIDQDAMASVTPASPGCGAGAKAGVESDQDVFTISTPMLAPKGMTSAVVTRIEPQAILADFRLTRGSSGGPVFTSGGDLVGITTTEANEDRRREDTRVIPAGQLCDVLSAAEKKMPGATPPRATRLPVEPLPPPDASPAAKSAERRAISASQFQVSSSDFDITFLTPMLVRDGRFKSPAVIDFGNWSDYVNDAPHVLLVRATPKFEESFWTTIARGAAQTQGVALPPMKKFTSNFARMRAYCGETEVQPIHPFIIERRVSEKDTIQEGLYVFDPAAFGADCARVNFVLYSAKEPAKGDSKTVDRKLIEQIIQM